MTTNNNTTKTKFTATLVTEQTKNDVVTLRNETNLSEKELMTLIVETALLHKGEILARAATVVEANKASQEARRKDAYQALKAKMAKEREVKAATKTPVTKPTTSTKPVKASGVAVAA